MVPQVAARARGAGLQPDLVLWLGAIVVAWMAAYWLEVSGVAHLLHHHTIYHSGHVLTGGLALLGVWQVMTAAMMLPGTLPAALQISRPGPQLAFIATYAVAWTVFAAVAFAGDMGVHALVHGWPPAAQHENLIPPTVLGTAALYQLSPWKRASLAACRRPLDTRCRVLDASVTYSLQCLTSGWALMLIMFSAGVADLFWMAALALVMLGEKTLASGDAMRYVAAVVLALLALEALAGGHLLLG